MWACRGSALVQRSELIRARPPPERVSSECHPGWSRCVSWPLLETHGEIMQVWVGDVFRAREGQSPEKGHAHKRSGSNHTNAGKRSVPWPVEPRAAPFCTAAVGGGCYRGSRRGVWSVKPSVPPLLPWNLHVLILKPSRPAVGFEGPWSMQTLQTQICVALLYLLLCLFVCVVHLLSFCKGGGEGGVEREQQRSLTLCCIPPQSKTLSPPCQQSSTWLDQCVSARSASCTLILMWWVIMTGRVLVHRILWVYVWFSSYVHIICW